jgi:hypothetical protein
MKEKHERMKKGASRGRACLVGGARMPGGRARTPGRGVRTLGGGAHA